MKKSILTAAIAILLLVCCAFTENRNVGRTFEVFYDFLEQTEIKIKRETITTEDARALKDFWLNKKKILHVWIPHADIKEIDLWLGETLAFTENENYEEALTKIQVLKILAKQIPSTYLLRIENVF